MAGDVLTRVVRRETHSPRTVATVVVLVVLAVAAAYVGTEIVLSLAGAAPLIATPATALAWLSAAPGFTPVAPTVVAGVVIAVVGVILLWLALAPGSRSKHQLAASDPAVVVDNGVIASAVAERVRRDLDVPSGGVVVGVSHRAADVTVRPDTGQTIDAADARRIAEDELESYRLSPALTVRARVDIATRGKERE